MHSRYSDGSGSVDDMVQAALRKGLNQITITDHMPLPFATRYAVKQLDISKYRMDILELQKKYSGALYINLGLEMEFISAHQSWIHDLALQDWDHLIISIHHLPGRDNSLHLVNGNAKEFASLIHSFNDDGKALCTHYYRTLQQGLITGWFDIVGHLDVIKKHNKTFSFFNEDDSWYRDLIYGTLELIRKLGMSMEINTGGFNHPPAEQYPSDWIINAAVKENIPIVLSSDSHAPATLGQHFSKIAQILSQ